MIVPDVNNFAGHIACDAVSRSEIVLPVFHQNQLIAVLDIDSEIENNFTEIDARYLEKIIQLLSS